ncbi:MAG: DNA mismatch repair protein MutS [Planctomycetota bacterium]|nr:MAG: DNA mismatch repair protein MutS [Planctomycetota bacterium]
MPAKNPPSERVQETPMMRQYRAAKRKHPQALLFFRMGDFYELFFDDAKVAARELGLALTARDKERQVPMAGVPVRAMESYLVRLVRAGHTVAICEQLQDPRECKGIVERDVVRVVSPGTLVEDEALVGSEPLFVLAVDAAAGADFGLAWADLSTGAFRCAAAAPAALAEELARIGPAEIVLADLHEADGAAATHRRLALVRELAAREEIPLTLRPPWTFDARNGARDLCEQLGVATLEPYGVADRPELLAACGALLDYLRDTQKGTLGQIRDLRRHEPARHLILDRATRRTLELVRSQQDGGRDGTLLAVLDRCETPMGSRRLRDWLLEPLVELSAILARQEAVAELFEDHDRSERLRAALDGMGDLERTAGKVAAGRAGARDLVALAAALERVPALVAGLSGCAAGALADLGGRLDPLADLAGRIRATLVEDPPLNLKEGGLVRDGFSSEVDELRALARGGKDYLLALQEREIERTGIPSLKVGFNRVFGYYLEITHAHRERVPEDYVRKQTLKNAERYITPELKEYEAKVLGAEEKVKALEYEIFTELREAAAAETGRLLATAAAAAELDALLALARVAVERRWCRPELCEEPAVLEIEEGRHPVVEAALRDEPFVPNDTRLGPDSRLVVLTGPNMSGKSTWLRQTALIVLLAQMGSFVPADRARIGLADRIFTRLGTGDDISRGQSTFMVEMVETADILRNASERSLLLLDEVGRGTSTFDGLAIAWAVCEYVHDRIGARCLFATHYHQLTDLAAGLERARNQNVAVREWGDEIVFLHRIEEGGTDRSYGIHVARLAGVPPEVLDRAREVLERLERDEEGLSRRILGAAAGAAAAAEPPAEPAPVQPSLFDLLEAADEDLLEELRRTEMDALAPIEAWRLVERIKRALGAP